MKKWAFAVVLLLTLGLATGMATTIDFSTCTAGSITGAGGVDCGGVNFFFDVSIAPTNTATIGPTGLVMSANGDPAGFGGVLDLTFAVPAGSMTFDFVIGPVGSLTADGFGLLVVLENSIDAAATDPATCTLVGLDGCGGTVSFSPASAPFPLANITPNPDATSLTISSLSFTDAPVTTPEPGTYAMFGSGLLLLGFGSRKLIKRRS